MRRFLALALLLPTLAQGTERQPWFGKDKEFELRAAGTYQKYHTIQTESGELSSDSDDLFLDLSLAISPVSRWNVEVELGVVHTNAQSFGLDSAKATARYLWLNDVIGDPVSLVTGVTLSGSPEPAEDDPSTPHHGNAEADVHVAVGKEFAEGNSWWLRLWGYVGVGWAFQKSPWAYGELAAEYNIDRQHLLRAFVRHRQGFGNSAFSMVAPFNGYGDLGYYGTDIGARYAYIIDYVGTLSLQITRRILADDMPEDVTAVTVAFLYPFGI